MHRTWILVFAWATLLPAVTLAKKVNVDMSTAPVAIGPSASKANGVISTDSSRLLRLFRELHDEMQVGRIEARVAGTIASELVGHGFDVAFGADGTEVVATLHNGAGPTLVYRADTGSDLLPQSAHTPNPPAGLAAQATHRCGHDTNVAWMLGMAKALVALRDEWAGTLVLVSQPTRLLRNGPPSFRADDTRRMPKADMVLALSAATSPLGSILSVRGQRRPGADAAELVLSRVGVYEAPRHRDAVSQLATSTTRLYGLPESAIFGYLLVGTAQRQPGEGLEASDLDAGDLEASDPEAGALEQDDGASGPDLAAIPLGTKLATVAVLELLRKAGSPQEEVREQARERGPAVRAREWTLHDY